MKLDQIKARVSENKTINGFVKACILLSINYGLRVSETLLLGGNEILANGNFYITAPKNKKVIVLNVGVLGEYEKVFRATKYNLGQTTDRFYLYRLYKRLGIVYHKKGNKYNSVTHAFRHMLAAEIRANNIDNKVITDTLHHKSKKSADSYGK